MTDRTRQIVDALLSAPKLVEALKQDPRAFAERFGISDRELLLLQTAKQIISDMANRLLFRDSSQRSASTPTSEPAGDRGKEAFNAQSNLPAAKDSSNAALVGVTALGAVTGILAVLGTVSIVGISARSRKDSSDVG